MPTCQNRLILLLQKTDITKFPWGEMEALSPQLFGHGGQRLHHPHGVGTYAKHSCQGWTIFSQMHTTCTMFSNYNKWSMHNGSKPVFANFRENRDKDFNTKALTCILCARGLHTFQPIKWHKLQRIRDFVLVIFCSSSVHATFRNLPF